MSLVQGRTPPGKSGRPYKLQANVFEVQLLPQGNVQHYDIDFPSGIKKQDRNQVIQYLVAKKLLFQGNPEQPIAFDGKRNLYMLVNAILPNKAFVVDENDVKQIKSQHGKPKNLTIKMTHANTINMNVLLDMIQGRASIHEDDGPMQAIQALNIVMKKPPVYDSGFPFKSATFYVPKTNPIESEALKKLFEGETLKPYLQGACDVWGGYFSSIRPGIGRMLLNVDRVSGPFIKPGNLVDILMEYMNANSVDRINPRNPAMPGAVRMKVLRFLRRLYVRVKTRDPKLKFTIQTVSKESAITFQFEQEAGKRTNVRDYFKATHNITLKYPDLPVVQITKNAFVPMEVCDISPGSNFFGRLSPAQVAEMLKSKFTTLSPRLKRQAIELGMRHLSINSPFHQGWNLKISPSFVEVNARQLPSPELLYRNSKGTQQSVPTQDGAWKTANLQGLKSGKKVERLLVVVFANNGPNKAPKWDGMPRAQVEDALMGFFKGCKEFGISFANERPNIFHAGDVQQVKEAIIAASKQAGYAPQTPPDLVVTFSSGSNQYDKIKQVCDVQLGVASQNLAIGKANGSRSMYWSNVALKVNVKLFGGVNQTIKGGLPGFKAVPTILFGADVTHPSPKSLSPSIAAVVASTDPEGVQYKVWTHIQDAKQEMIDDLSTAVNQHLKTFHMKNNKTKPKRIIFYRDGVSEGQFKEVTEKEIQAIRDACTSLDANYRPTITYIICGKRHNYRFFPMNDKDADRSGNVKAGTVIDTQIVHPEFDDYYLQSHAGLLGTSKCCHYTILVDENKMGKDMVETLTYQLAYLMPRATRSISMAAPAQYAHMACDRARKHLGKQDDESVMGDSQISDDERRKALLDEARKLHSQVNNKVSDVLYFM